MTVKPKQGQCADKPDYRVSTEQRLLVNTVVTECLPAHTILSDAVIFFLPHVLLSCSARLLQPFLLALKNGGRSC